MPSFTEIEAQINSNIDKRIKKFAKLVKDELDIDLDKITGEQLSRLKSKLSKLIKKAGLDQLSSVIIGFFDDVELESGKQFLKSTPVDKEAFEKLIIDRAEAIAQLGLEEDLVNIEKDLTKRFRGKLKVRDLKKLSRAGMSKLVNSLLKATVAQTETATATAVFGYDRAVTTLKAESLGLENFKYAGAKDSKNRPFCKKRVGKIFSNAEASRWNNGQKSPASIYLGGYNCRHRKVYQVD